MASVHIHDVSKTFQTGDHGAFTVFDHVDLDIQPGEFVSLLGPSGCGKSTLLNLIAGLDRVSSGAITVGDRTISKPGPDRGVVFQEPALMPWQNILENVMFALRKKMSKHKAKEIAMHYLQLVHLKKFIDSYPHELSGGMKQRVAIARALAMDPDILLMDEPFCALDEQTRMMLQHEVLEIWDKMEKTIVFVTHNIREAIILSDRIVLMGTRPGGILNVYDVNLPRPRQATSEVFVEELGANVIAEWNEVFLGQELPSVVLVTSKKFLEEHPEHVDQVLTAHVRSVEFAQQNVADTLVSVNDEVFDLTQSRLPEIVLEKAWERLEITHVTHGDALQQWATASYDLEFLSDEPNLDGFVDTSYLDRVLAGAENTNDLQAINR